MGIAKKFLYYILEATLATTAATSSTPVAAAASAAIVALVGTLAGEVAWLVTVVAHLEHEQVNREIKKIRKHAQLD